MRKYRFYKVSCPITGERKWFIDLKWFPFNKAWLEMVAGADELLDKLAGEDKEVTLQIDTYPIPFYDGKLVKYKNVEGMDLLLSGRFYQGESGFDNGDATYQEVIWLCPVTVWVFLKYPEKIYYKKL